MIQQIDYDLIEIMKAMCVGIVVIFITFILFKYIWLQSEHYTFPDLFHFKISNKNGIIKFFKILRFLGKDFLNYEFWIEKIGFDAYSYLLLLRKITLTLIVYLMVYMYSSFIYITIDLLLSLQNTRTNYFQQQAGVIYTTIMMFVITFLFLIAIRDFRREIQQVYGFYLLKGEQEKGVAFFREKSILIKQIDKDLKETELQEGINKFFKDKNVKGEVAICKILPEYKKLIKLQKKKVVLEVQREMYLKNIFNKFSLFFRKSNIKNQEDYELKIAKINLQIQSIIGNNKNSSYAFAYLTTYASIDKLKCVAKQKQYIDDFYSYFPEGIQQIKVEDFIDPLDIDWRFCHTKNKVNFWKYFWKIVIFFLLIFMTTPTAFFNFLTQNVKMSYILDKYVYQKNELGFFMKSFLPPLLIILINRLILVFIFIQGEQEQKSRKSRYHIIVMEMAFFYFFFNMLIVPGFAVPTGSTLYSLFIDNLAIADQILQNFYLIHQGNFFIILLIQQTCFGLFGQILQPGLLWYYRGSPSCYLYWKKFHQNKFETFVNEPISQYPYGYSQAINLTILAIIFIYSIQIPLVLVFGIIYYIMKLYSDMYLLVGVFKNDVESGGSLVLNSLNKIVFNLIFFQICLFFYILSSQYYINAFLIFVTLCFTIIFYFINKKPFLNLNLYKVFEKDHKELDKKLWNELYQHPLHKCYRELKQRDFHDQSFQQTFQMTQTILDDQNKQLIYKLNINQFLIMLLKKFIQQDLSFMNKVIQIHNLIQIKF